MLARSVPARPWTEVCVLQLPAPRQPHARETRHPGRRRRTGRALPPPRCAEPALWCGLPDRLPRLGRRRARRHRAEKGAWGRAGPRDRRSMDARDDGARAPGAGARARADDQARAAGRLGGSPGVPHDPQRLPVRRARQLSPQALVAAGGPPLPGRERVSGGVDRDAPAPNGARPGHRRSPVAPVARDP